MNTVAKTFETIVTTAALTASEQNGSWAWTGADVTQSWAWTGADATESWAWTGADIAGTER